MAGCGRLKWMCRPRAFDEFILTRKRISEHAGLTETFCWVLSILYLGSGCRYQYDSQAFLFSLVNEPGWPPVKFDQTASYGSHQSNSTYSCYNGPVFGGPSHDLKLDPSHYHSHSDLGNTYSMPSAIPSSYSVGSPSARSFLAGSYQFNPDEIETFYEAAFTSQGRFED